MRRLFQTNDSLKRNGWSSVITHQWLDGSGKFITSCPSLYNAYLNAFRATHFIGIIFFDDPEYGGSNLSAKVIEVDLS